MKIFIWTIWLLITASGLACFGYMNFYAEDRTDLLIGEATHGHHQIEIACNACHSEPLGGPEVLQNACINCHGEQLTQARDKHPKKKFTNPRNAALAEILDAKKCVTCHTEHQLEQTGPMGLTIAQDFCFHCHQDVGVNRPSHKELTFDTCASAGCHNYHDNRALYEDFLVQNAGQPWITHGRSLAQANFSHYKAFKPKTASIRPALVNIAAEKIKQHSDINQHWTMSQHARANVTCLSCHAAGQGGDTWVEKPGIESCQTCHADEVVGFTSGKHGMRLASNLPNVLSPMTPSQARLSFTKLSQHQELSCNSCHDVHELNTQVAAVDSCLNCHADEHSQNYLTSPHADLWKQELSGVLEPGSGVSCANCHMPRLQGKGFINKDKGIKPVRVEHNQSLTLRPNEKMIRPVCMQCHSLEFSIDALADEALIKNNFNGQPAAHIESIDWAVRRVKQ